MKTAVKASAEIDRISDEKSYVQYFYFYTGLLFEAEFDWSELPLLALFNVFFSIPEWFRPKKNLKKKNPSEKAILKTKNQSSS